VNFIAMEFTDGETLRELMQSAPIKLTEAVDVAAQVASRSKVIVSVGYPVDERVGPTIIEGLTRTREDNQITCSCGY
jgi:hypothetical protein